jgi:HK97 family phage major capsid protein
MPYEIREMLNGKWCVHKKGEDKPIACHDTEGDAEAQVRALYASESDKSIATIKSLTDEVATVAGYGVVFGGKDMDAETFTKDTDLDLALVPVKRVFYDHTIGNVKHSLGAVIKATVDDVGVWIEAELQRSKAYVAEVLKLIEAGALGWSSGSVPHLVRREGGVIKSWPVVEFSLTPTPCEPRTLGVERIKAMAEADPAFKALLPMASGEDAAGANKAEAEAAMETNVEVRQVMDEKDIAALVERVATDTAAKAVDAYKASLPAIESGLKVVADHDAERPFKSFGEQLVAIRNASMPGRAIDDRLWQVQNKALKVVPSGLNESIGAEGGFLVQPDFASELIKRSYDMGAILSRVRKFPVSGNTLTINGVDETSRANGSRWGGVEAHWLVEGGTKAAHKPKFYQHKLELRKLASLCYVTDELLQDSVALGSIVEQAFSEEIMFKTENAIVNGSGAGEPLGIMNGGCMISVTKENNQAADTVVFENILKMWSRAWGAGRKNAVWLISQDVEPQLYSMGLAVGAGGSAVYLPSGGLSVAPYATLFGRPVLPVEYCDNVGDSGDIILADFSQYALIDKPAATAYSIHFMFSTDEQTFRVVYRVDGQPLWKNALTPYNGGSTLSPFVKLDARA